VFVSLLSVALESLSTVYIYTQSPLLNFDLFFFILTYLVGIWSPTNDLNGGARLHCTAGRQESLRLLRGFLTGGFFGCIQGYVLLSFHGGFSFAMGREEELTKVSYFYEACSILTCLFQDTPRVRRK